MKKEISKTNTPRQRYLRYLVRLDESFALDKEDMGDRFYKCLEIAKSLEFQNFGNGKPFNGDTCNLIFLTYSDHASGNAGVWQSVGSLHHHHDDADDRGYIKGIALDLNNYLKLREIAHNFTRSPKNDDFLGISQYIHPTFKNTEKNEILRQKANEKEKELKQQLLEIHMRYHQRLNEFLKEKTGISALYYLREI